MRLQTAAVVTLAFPMAAWTQLSLRMRSGGDRAARETALERAAMAGYALARDPGVRLVTLGSGLKRKLDSLLDEARNRR
ncbi:MAG: hypothetical protein HY554_04990 [Elusimicrobia bacterium]|nr:hypothetical protein [Elusimicrobiota bacterium]